MKIWIDEEIDLKVDFDYHTLAKDILKATMEYEDVKEEVEISLLLTSDDAIREINKEQRKIDRETDVLSFPNFEFSTPGCLPEPIMDYDRSPETDDIILGDIVISIDRMLAQANEYGHSVKREYAFLITHSLLHLLGYDHMDEEDSNIMEHKQEEILIRLGINR